MKFPFQRYIVCWGKIYGSKIIGGGAAPSHLRLLFCKIVYIMMQINICYLDKYGLLILYQDHVAILTGCAETVTIKGLITSEMHWAIDWKAVS